MACFTLLAGAFFLAALMARDLRGALPPVDWRAVCLVRAMILNEDIQCIEIMIDFVQWLEDDRDCV